MSSTPGIPCPICGGRLRVRKSGLLVYDRTGLLIRECLVECLDCGRRGKALRTVDVAMYPDAVTME